MNHKIVLLCVNFLLPRHHVPVQILLFFPSLLERALTRPLTEALHSFTTNTVLDKIIKTKTFLLADFLSACQL